MAQDQEQVVLVQVVLVQVALVLVLAQVLVVLDLVLDKVVSRLQEDEVNPVSQEV